MNGNIFITDIDVPLGFDEEVQQLAKESDRELVIFDCFRLTEGLLELLPSADYLFSNQIALLFPGKGAVKVLNYIDILSPGLIDELKKQRKIIQFECNRFSGNPYKPLEYPRVNLPEWFNPVNYSKLIIIDDVVGSGKTMQQVRHCAFNNLSST